VNPIALQTAILPGTTVEEKLETASAIGADGIELMVDDAFYEQIPRIVDSLGRYGLRAAALRIGHTRLIHPEFREREHALVKMRKALAAAVDLGASGVVFYGHYSSQAVLPDLHPYKSSVELEAELLVAELRTTLCDLAYALGARLLLAHADSTRSTLLRRPEHVSLIRNKLDNHPYLFVATSFSHLDAESIKVAQALSVSGLGYVAVSDSAGLLPGQGQRDWKHFGESIKANHYNGWITVEGQVASTSTELRAAVEVIRRSLS